MSAVQNKTGGGNPPANHNTLASHSRIPAAGFTALRHLLDASRTLHQLPALPDDAIQGARILLTRIDADLVRLEGAK